MSIVYTWRFEAFEKAPVEGELVDVVKVIHWRLEAADGDFSTSTYGTVTLPPANEDDFVAFEDLTKQWAIDAVSSVLDVPTIEASLAGAIDNMRSPSVVSTLPPFQN